MAKPLHLVNGQITQIEATVVSAGAGDAGDLVALNGSGILDNSVMPVGIGADTASIQASEALSAGDLVNVHDVAGGFRVRKADGSSAGKTVDGFVLAAVASGAQATVYKEGSNNQVSGLTPGARYLSVTVPGGTQAAPPTVAGQVSQRVGTAFSATVLDYAPQVPVLLS